MFETFEHTADLGLRIRSETLKGLFKEAALALFSVIVIDPKTICPIQSFSFEIQGTNKDELLLDWLCELLFTFSNQHVVLGRFEVDISGTGLKARAWGEPCRPNIHQIGEEVKAITYHGLKVEEIEGHWIAEVIIDL